MENREQDSAATAIQVSLHVAPEQSQQARRRDRSQIARLRQKLSSAWPNGRTCSSSTRRIPRARNSSSSYDEVAQFNPRLIYADITGYGDTGPDAALPGFDITAYWSRTGLLSLLHDAGAPPTWPFAGTGDAPSGVGLFAAIVTALYRRERTGKGSSVTTSLLAAGVWSAGVAIQAALAGAKFAPQHDRKNPANAAMNVYKSSDNIWFVIVATPDKIPALAAGIGRADLLKDPRFADPAKLAANMRRADCDHRRDFQFTTDCALARSLGQSAHPLRFGARSAATSSRILSYRLTTSLCRSKAPEKT